MTTDHAHSNGTVCSSQQNSITYTVAASPSSLSELDVEKTNFENDSKPQSLQSSSEESGETPSRNLLQQLAIQLALALSVFLVGMVSTSTR
jgi:hypothetical protein